MSDRAEDLIEWRSEQYAKNAKSQEPKVWLTVDEAKAIQEKLNTFLICAKPRYEKLMKKDINLLSKRIKQAEKIK